MDNTIKTARAFLREMDKRKKGEWWSADNEELAVALVEYANRIKNNTESKKGFDAVDYASSGAL